MKNIPSEYLVFHIAERSLWNEENCVFVELLDGRIAIVELYSGSVIFVGRFDELGVCIKSDVVQFNIEEG